MTRSSPPSSTAAGAPPVTTETFQKHYGRGSGYPPEPPHHGHPPPHQNYPPSQHYASGGQHAPPHLPPPVHGYGAHPSWYYPPREANSSRAPSSDTRRNAPRAAKASVPPSLVTPKSHDSETLPPVAEVANKAVANTKPPAKSTNKKSNGSKKSKKESSSQLPSSNNDGEPEMEEEPRVEPMKQDFHYYAMEHYEDAKQASQQQLEESYADGSITAKKNKELYLLTTLLNSRLIQNWEEAPPSTRAEYLKKEEADRKRFMSEEEVASRHCATLTARRRSPKQSTVGGVGRAGSFGLSATVQVPSAVDVASSLKRSNSEVVDTDVTEGAAKRVKAV